MKVRPLEEADLALTLKWRNESREWFHDTRIITPENHLAWFRALTLADRMYVIEDDEPVAQFSLTGITTAVAVFGRLLVAPQRRRQRIGHLALQTAIQIARRAGVQRLRLEVKSDNAAARHLYRAVEFVEVDTHDGTVYMEKTL